MVNWNKFINGRSIDYSDLMPEKVVLLLERGVIEPKIVDCEKIQKLEKQNVVVDSEIECASNQRLNDLINDLLAAKKNNVELRLEMDVLVEKVLAQDSLLKEKAVMFSLNEVSDDLQRWNRAAVVYVLGAKLSFHVIKDVEARGRVMEASAWYIVKL
ncbi:hypothetical protein LguiA_025575 [Lonicera macranthoides]